MNHIDTMKLALNYLDGLTRALKMDDTAHAYQVIAALREALAEQPAQQKPVAWTNWRELVGARHYRTPGWEMYADKRNPDDVALYTSPPTLSLAQRKPLPAHEIVTMYDESPTSDSDMIAFARAIEAAHGIKEKNT